MKRILVVSNMYPSKQFPSYGVFVRNFCDQLSSLGYDYDLAVLTKTQNKAKKIVKYMCFYFSVFFKALLGKYDLVYIHYPSFSAAPVNIATRVRKLNIITNVHGSDVIALKPEHEKMMKHTKKAIENSKKLVVPSEYFRKTVIEKYGIEADRVFVYPSGGINASVFYSYDEEKKNGIKKEYGIDQDTLVLGYVSRINRVKGWDVFLDAIRKIDSLKDKKLKVFIVGSGEDDQLLQKEIEQLPEHLRRAVIRYPLLDQRKLAEIYNVLDVFLFPTVSASESLGLVAIEAMACGVPVIASDYAAPAYYVVDGVNGYKFKKGNSEELASRLTWLIEHGENRRVLSEGALKTAAQYSTKAVKAALADILSFP